MTRHVTVELFRAPLEIDAVLLSDFERTLSSRERARAQRMRARRDRARLIADLGWRRRLLGERLGLPPAELAFGHDEHGKPHLEPPGPHFSASRSDDLAWYALSDHAPVGVDAERIERGRPLAPLARRLLSVRERALLDAVPADERVRALYGCWTCKEAAGKALGTGLVFPVTTLEAWSTDGRPVRAQGLEIRQLNAGAERAAAVAVRVEPDEVALIAPVLELARG